MYESEFALDEDLVYLNHAAVAPWPRCTADAVKAFADENATLGARRYTDWMATEVELKRQLQRLINARSDAEIALLKNTSEALSVVAYGLDWQAGDNIVITNQEFPSNRLVWESLAKFRVETRHADLARCDTAESAIIARMDDRTRLVAVSSVQYATGLRLDLTALGAACRERGVLFCVDAIQSLGALALDVQACQADYVMADAHKWLLGPEGVALFYCRRAAMDLLDLKQYGWHMVEESLNFDAATWKIAGNARRFECGSPNMTGIHALHASLGLIERVGIPGIQERILDNSRFLFDFFNDLTGSYRLVTPQAAGRYGGIVTFQPLRQSTASLYERLQRENIICALRGDGIRFSPHFYTTREKLACALALLPT
jgi:cysteine desulfurase/selenocysteine lyase